MAQEMKSICIMGGGLAGLALGIALRRRNVPVILHEALHYPRHRVCGEFISGVKEQTLTTLGIADLFKDVPRPSDVAWWSGEKSLGRFSLPNPAYAISRYRLDQALCHRLRNSGAEIHENSRQIAKAQEGTIWSAGRRPTQGEWIGLKAHIRSYDLKAGLEMHLGDGGYVGLVNTDEGWINVCGLFRLQPDVNSKNSPILLSYLRRVGLDILAERLKAAEWRDGSQSAVAGFRLGWQPPMKNLACLGDAQSIIPPFTGNGMSMALEAAALAVDPLVKYANQQLSWSQANSAIHEYTNKAFDRRLQLSCAFQHLLLAPWFRKPLEILSEQNLLPFRTLFHLTRH